MNDLEFFIHHSRNQTLPAQRRSTDDNHGDASMPSASEIHQSTSIYQKLNDSVYQLHVPSANQPDMDILFFHGLQLQQTSESEVHIDTWRSTCAEKTLWPKEWLPKDFPDARVLIISYDGGLRKTDEQGRMDLYLVAETLLTAFRLAKVGQIRPVILIGHSYGGLVIKQLCVLAYSKISMPSPKSTTETQQLQALLKSIGGIFYYGPPHRGSGLMDVIGRSDNKEGELVKHVEVFSKDLARLNQDFQNLSNTFPWLIYTLGETMPTKLEGRKPFVVVEEGSARCEPFVSVQEDHFSICKPKGTKSTNYQALVEFIREVHCNCKPMEEISVIVDCRDVPEDLQTLPRTQVGLLASLARGEILEKVKMFTVLGLWGMGGIGKTTLSKAIFNHVHSQFEYTLFVENVKSYREDRNAFEETLLGAIHHRGRKMRKSSEESSQWGMHPRGKKMQNPSNQHTLSPLIGKKVLMVLDDIESDRDIEIVHKLLNDNSCSADSRIILTSRDRHILDQVNRIHVVEVNELDRANSLTLFKSYAFSCPDSDLSEWQENCMESIVERCGGLPLVLEVIGKYLRGSDSKDVWEAACNSLGDVEGGETTGMNKVWSKLQISYDNLADEEKQMFIDASTVFQDHYYRICELRKKETWWTLEEAKAIWRMKYKNGALHWRTLVDRALVYEGEEGLPIKIHEHLRTLGRNLAKDMEDIKRIPAEDVQNLSTVLQQCDKLKRIQTLQLISKGHGLWRHSPFDCMIDFMPDWFNRMIGDTGTPNLSIANLERMEMLEYLQLDGCRLVGRKLTLPPKLLMFVGRIRGDNLCFDFSRNLIFLNINVWTTSLPRSLRSLQNLQFLELVARRLQWLPESFGNLSHLRRCTLVCPRLKKLPDSLGNLGNLERCTLVCPRLKNLPGSFGNLGNLQRCTLVCPGLKNLPDSFGNLGNLQRCTLVCRRLRNLPDSFGNLGNLRELRLSGYGLMITPWSFGISPRRPCSFGLSMRLGLRNLPSSFGRLKNLEELGIWVPWSGSNIAFQSLERFIEYYNEKQQPKVYAIFSIPSYVEYILSSGKLIAL